MSKLKVGILGAGNIAASMTTALHGIAEEAVPYAVASRSLDKAQAFAQAHSVQKAYGSYEELVNDPEVDLVYVATPHALHYENARLCLEHGKPVLVEKSFTGNARQAQELISLSNEKKVFLAEAFWTRFIPARHIVRELLESGIIGKATSMKAVFEAPMTHIPRLTDPALAGGALLDIGVYTLNFASMFFGDDVEKIETTCVKYKTGVDGTDDIYYTYHDGKTAHLHTSILADSVTRNGTIFGTKGSVFVEKISNYTAIRVYDREGSLLKDCPIPPQVNGYEYEILACKQALQNGKLECDEMPHQMTLAIMRRMDMLRETWGVRFPFDE